MPAETFEVLLRNELAADAARDRRRPDARDEDEDRDEDWDQGRDRGPSALVPLDEPGEYWQAVG